MGRTGERRSCSDGRARLGEAARRAAGRGVRHGEAQQRAGRPVLRALVGRARRPRELRLAAWGSRPRPASAPAGRSGVLNGIGVDADGRPSRDPNHGLPGDHEFHPVLVEPRSDDDLREDLRRFARSFVGGWRWSTKPTMNCRLFQLAMLDAVGLVDGTGNYRTRGSGCPALAPVRRASARVSGQRRWPRNLPPPGQQVPRAISAGPGER